MNADMEKYSQQLRQLVDEYYHQQMPLDAYRAQRKLILDQIESEYAASTHNSEGQQVTEQAEQNIDTYRYVIFPTQGEDEGRDG